MRRLLDGAPERRVHDARLPDGDVELLEEELEEGEDARGEAEPLLSRNSSAVMDIQSLFIRGEVEPLPRAASARARRRRAAARGSATGGAARGAALASLRHDSHVTTAREVASEPCRVVSGLRYVHGAANRVSARRQCSGVPLRGAAS